MWKSGGCENLITYSKQRIREFPRNLSDSKYLLLVKKAPCFFCCVANKTAPFGFRSVERNWKINKGGPDFSVSRVTKTAKMCHKLYKELGEEKKETTKIRQVSIRAGKRAGNMTFASNGLLYTAS